MLHVKLKMTPFKMCSVKVQKICIRGVITVIEQQRQVVLGSTALFTKVGQLRIHITYEGWDNFLFV